MLQFIEAGLVAAVRQLVAVAIITVTAMLLTPRMAVHEASVTGSNAEISYDSVSAFLPRAYLLTAIGLILIKSRSVNATAERIRRTSRLVGSQRDLRTFAAQLGLLAAIVAMFAVRLTPALLIEFARYFRCASVATIVWAGSMTVAMTGLGATAHAAARALRSMGVLCWSRAESAVPLSTDYFQMSISNLFRLSLPAELSSSFFFWWVVLVRVTVGHFVPPCGNYARGNGK